jgi:hypothetical protein
MKTEHKLLVAQSLLPVLADFLEDQPFNREFKMKANLVINVIRGFDRMFMNDTNTDIIDQQINIQLWFRQQLNEAFTTHPDSEPFITFDETNL